MRMQMRTIKSILLMGFLLSLIAMMVIAAPTGPTITQDTTSKRTAGVDNATDGKQITAEAGNVTQLTINSVKVTQYWQGYYGNVTGIITLDNANNQTFYDWSIPTPLGEVYASNSSISAWANVVCINTTYNLPGFNCSQAGSLGDTNNPECLNVTEIESYYGISESDRDGINETFDKEINITVGSRTLNNCAGTYLYVNDSSQVGHWQEALLNINNTETIIFASKLEDNFWGYSNQTWDFQLLVGEKAAAGITPYWFYVELS